MIPTTSGIGPETDVHEPITAKGIGKQEGLSTVFACK